MKHLFTCLLLLAFTVVSGCGAGPDSEAIKFIRALESGDFDRVEALILPSERTTDDQERAAGVKMMAMIQMAIADEGGISSVEAIETEINDDSARVRVRISFGNGNSDEDTVRLQRSGRRWYVASMDSLG